MRIKSETFWVVGGGVAILLIFLLLASAQFTSKPVATIADPSSLSDIQTGNAPWSNEIATLAVRLKAIGLPALSQEGTVLHIHQHLDIFVDGQPVAVPAGVGINQAAQFISPIHVHDDTGVIHVESPQVQTSTLGQFFDVWGVKFTKDSIGGYVATGDKTLKVYVNGKLYESDPRTLALEAHQEIVIAYGTDKELPNPILASYSFPAGE